MDLAKQVASATAALVMQAKTVASRSTDQAIQNQVIANATQCALSTSQLVACTKVGIAPYAPLVLPHMPPLVLPHMPH